MVVVGTAIRTDEVCNLNVTDNGDFNERGVAHLTNEQVVVDSAKCNAMTDDFGGASVEFVRLDGYVAIFEHVQRSSGKESYCVGDEEDNMVAEEDMYGER